MSRDWKFWKTTDMEKCAEALARTHQHSIIKKRYDNLNAIFFRTKNVHNTPLYIWNPRHKSVDEQLTSWIEKGGVLIDNSKGWDMDDRVPDYDATLFVEAPIDFCYFRIYAKRCRRDVIAFRPPTWAEHETTVARLYPTGLMMTLALEKVMERIAQGLPAKHAQVLKDCGLEVGSHTLVISDRELADELGIEKQEMTSLRSHIMADTRRRYHPPIMCVVPRIEPDRPEFMPFYRHIESLPDRFGGERYCDEHKLRKLFKNYKEVLRLLAREGSIEMRPYLHVWDMRPNGRIMTDLIDRRHRKAIAELQFLKQSVDEAPAFPL